MTLLNGGQYGGDSPTKLRVLGAARKSEVKATQNLSIIVAFFVVCWMPLYTINCVQAFCPECLVPAPLLHCCIVLSHLNSAGNPLLYAYHLKDFRNAFRSLLTCSGKDGRRRQQQLNTASATAATAAAVAAVVQEAGCTAVATNNNKNGRSVGEPTPSVMGARQQSDHQCCSAAANTDSSTLIAIDQTAPVLLSVRRLVD